MIGVMGVIVEDFSTFILVIETYRFVARVFGSFLRRGLVVILCSAVALFLALQGGGLNLPPDVLHAVIALFAALAMILALRFTIDWHRYPLLPEIEGPQRWFFAVTYLRATLVILFFALLPPIGALAAIAVLGTAVSLPVTILAAFLTATAIGKLSLAWPAAAIGRRHVLRHGWVMSSGLVPRLILTLLLTSAPFHLAAIGLLYLNAVFSLASAWQGLLVLAVALLVLLGITTGATALSFAYRWRLLQDNSHWWRHAG